MNSVIFNKLRRIALKSINNLWSNRFIIKLIWYLREPTLESLEDSKMPKILTYHLSVSRNEKYVVRYIHGIFLIVVVFDLASCLYLSPDFIHRLLIFFVRLCAIEWGIDHNSIMSRSWVISQYVKSIFCQKISIFWQFALKRLLIMLQGHKI